MGESDNIFYGEDLPFDVPPYTLGQIAFQALITAPPDDDLLIESETGRSITNSGFLQQSIQTAEAMRETGFEKGDCAVLLGKQGIDISVAATATLFLGGNFAPMDPGMKPYEMEQLIKIVEPKVIFADADISDVMSEMTANLETEVTVVLLFSDPEMEYPFTKIEDFMKEDIDLSTFQPAAAEDNTKSVAIQAFSSGSTGLPKAVMIPDKAMVVQVLIMKYLGEKMKFTNATWLQISHFFWITGVLLYIVGTSGAQKRIIVRNLTPKNILEAIDKYKPIITFLPPAHIDIMLSEPEFDSYDLTSLKFVNTGGAALSKATYENLMSKWPSPIHLIQSYGCTELGGGVCATLPGQDPLSAGSPAAGVKLKIVNGDGETCGLGEEGEIHVKSPCMMLGYAKNEEATSEAVDEDGWFHTGDVGLFDGSVLYIRGRIKELIKFKSMQIAPAEIEALIHTIPGVADVGVAGIKHDPYTYYPMALVVKEEGSDITEEDIMKCVNENLSDYKHLRGGVCFVDEIPRTPTGKIKRMALQSLAETLYLGD